MKKKYELVIEHVDKLIELGQLKQGERLPTIRTMVTKLRCNKSTVIRAYKELEANHRIYSIPKSGYYLLENNLSNNDDYKVIDFSQVIPDPKLLPYKEFNHCVNKAIELYKNNLFSYGDTQGLMSLRKVLVTHLSDYQIFTSKENVYITSGSQQALSILSKMNFPNGKKNILVEQPTYRLMLKIVEMNGDKLIGITRTGDGIDFKELEEIFKQGNIKLFYTIPRFHNPLGTNYSEDHKKKIVELANKYDVYIVEDDYLADIDTNKKVLPLFYYDTSDKVIYIKSFSKAFMPGIRIGAVVMSNQLKKEFLKHKRYDDLSTSVLAQGALEIFINSGMYSNHMKKVQYAYKKKMNYLKECLNGGETRNIHVNIPKTGFFVWVRIKGKINMTTLVKRLEERNVYISSGNEFYIENDSVKKNFRICISILSEEKIRKGILILLEETNKMME